MSVPERYWRFPGDAIGSLSVRFGLPFDESMQDWEHEVADANRLAEFLAALEGNDLNDDERFTLGEIVMQCFEDLCGEGQDISASSEWHRFVGHVRAAKLLGQRLGRIHGPESPGPAILPHHLVTHRGGREGRG